MCKYSDNYIQKEICQILAIGLLHILSSCLAIIGLFINFPIIGIMLSTIGAEGKMQDKQTRQIETVLLNLP